MNDIERRSTSDLPGCQPHPGAGLAFKQNEIRKKNKTKGSPWAGAVLSPVLLDELGQHLAGLRPRGHAEFGVLLRVLEHRLHLRLQFRPLQVGHQPLQLRHLPRGRGARASGQQNDPQRGTSGRRSRQTRKPTGGIRVATGGQPSHQEFVKRHRPPGDVAEATVLFDLDPLEKDSGVARRAC